MQVNQLPMGLTVGKIIKFRCNGQPIQELVIVTPIDRWGLQYAIERYEGYKLCQIAPDTLWPHTAKEGIGYYDLKNPEAIPPDQVENLKLLQIQYGHNPNAVYIPDSLGQTIKIPDPKTSLSMLDKYRKFPAGPDPIQELHYRNRTAYWQDLYDKLSLLLANGRPV